MEKLLEVTWSFRLKFILVSVRLLWDTFNWRQTTSIRNIYHPSCPHSDWALQLMKALAAPSLFLLLSAPFWAHQHFMPAQMHSFQEWTWLFSNSHLPSPPNVHLVYQLSAITDVTSNSLSSLRNTHDFCLQLLQTLPNLYLSLATPREAWLFHTKPNCTTAAAFHTEAL